MRFPEILRARLESEGFKTRPWVHYVKLLPYETLTFERGTVGGLIYATGSTLHINAIHNEPQGNGQFSGAMDAFESVAHALGFAVRVEAFFGPRLPRHLTEKRGYILGKDFAILPP